MTRKLSVLLLVALVASACTASRAFRLRTSFVNGQRASIEFAAAERRDGAIAFGIHTHLDKGKTLLLPCLAIGDNADAVHLAVLLEQGSDSVLGHVITEISYKNILHR